MRRYGRFCLLLAMAILISDTVFPQAFHNIQLKSRNPLGLGYFGISVANAGDVNNDGMSDIISGAVNEGTAAHNFRDGLVYVFSGKDSRIIRELSSPTAVEGGAFGKSVAGIGDVNRDGFADILVGAHNETPPDGPAHGGMVHLFSGKDGIVLRSLQSVDPYSGSFGHSLANVGDIDSDGVSDILIGDPGRDVVFPSLPNTGAAYLYGGADGSLLFSFTSPAAVAQGRFGNAVAAAGDVNNDGIPDIIIGAKDERDSISNLETGKAYIFSGADGSLLYSLQPPAGAGGSNFGISVSALADIDFDGHAEVLIGANATPSEDGSTISSGAVYIFNGKDGSMRLRLNSPLEQAYGAFGTSVSHAADINRDQIPEIIVGAPGEAPLPFPAKTGRAYIFSGSDGKLIRELTSAFPQAGGNFGQTVSGAGDLNRDRIGDVIIGSYSETVNDSPASSGSVYLFSSSQTCTSVPIKPGWNLIGLPCRVKNQASAGLYPDHTPGLIYSYDGSYQTEQALQHFQGYWAHFLDADTILIPGSPLVEGKIELQEGWNLISGPGYEYPIDAMADPGDIISGSIFTYDSGYRESDVLMPGKGYWIYAVKSGTIATPGTIARRRGSYKVSGSDFENSHDGGRLYIEDSHNNKETLYYSSDINSRQMQKYNIKLPPIPPSDAFDVRFSGDSRGPAALNAKIHLQGCYFPITVSLENFPHQEGKTYLLEMYDADAVAAGHLFQSGASLQINDPRISGLRIRMANTEIPQGYRLEQNFPNPFNPETLIRFSLPASAKATVSIFNLRGQLIRRVLDEDLESGRHQIVWDGRNATGESVGSGIYFYRLRTTGFSEVKQMLLIR